MRRFVLILTAALPFFAAVLIQYIVMNLLAFAYRFYAEIKFSLEQEAEGISRIEEATAADLAMPQELLYILSVIGILVCGVVFFLWYRYELKGEPKGNYKAVFTVKYVGLFAFLGIGCQLFFSGILSLITPYFLEIFTDYSKVLQTLTSGNHIVVLLLMTMIAPVTEELIFRGVILHTANRYVSFLGANLLQAILFGIYHDNIVQGIYATLLGLVLGLMYYKFRSILAPILLHVFINASSFLLYLFPNTTISYILILAVGIVLMAITLYCIEPFKEN